MTYKQRISLCNINIYTRNKLMHLDSPTHLDNVVHEGHLEHGIQFNAVVLQYVLQRPLRTVLGEDGTVWLRLHTKTDEAYQVFVLEVLHLMEPRSMFNS